MYIAGREEGGEREKGKEGGGETNHKDLQVRHEVADSTCCSITFFIRFSVFFFPDPLPWNL